MVFHRSKKSLSALAYSRTYTHAHEPHPHRSFSRSKIYVRAIRSVAGGKILRNGGGGYKTAKKQIFGSRTCVRVWLFWLNTRIHYTQTVYKTTARTSPLYNLKLYIVSSLKIENHIKFLLETSVRSA